MGRLSCVEEMFILVNSRYLLTYVAWCSLPVEADHEFFESMRQ